MIMEIVQAIILGIVEGVTEFLPISSTGHLIVAEELMNYKDTSKMFTVVIQMGAIAAVIWYYRKDLLRLFEGLLSRDTAIMRFWLVWIIGTVPAGLIGLLLDKRLEVIAVATTVAVALILGGIAIWIIETFHRPPPPSPQPAFSAITTRQALAIGLYQTLSLIPGVSRSGATILGGMLSGLDRVTATGFSFYLGIPILLIAGVYKLITGDVSTIPGGGLALFFGLITSFITALAVVAWLLRYVSRHDFKVFAYYRVLFGVFLLIIIKLGWLG